MAEEKVVEAADPTKVYVANLAWSVTEDQLSEFFAKEGFKLVKATIFMRRGRSAGSALIQCGSAADAEKAIEKLTEKEYEGRPLTLRADRGGAKPTPPEKKQKPKKEKAAKEGGEGAAEAGDKKKKRKKPAKARAPKEGAEEGEKKPKAKKPKKQAAADPSKKGLQVYVGNLPWATDDDQLKAQFKGAASAEVVRSKSGRSRGYGLVLFTKEADAKAALEANGREFEGRPMAVRLDRDHNDDA
eukprot:NODE_3455_length_890_cov_229.771953_g3433_i0.p1 GENE.NODE_3455_length_890_cov_229.771953_g3433_i0~~NODE_3455_length_890_cov_229.771953_g3433_i0.p1  ORF type:complete len:267 (-),score=92.94 NODE_3455_length_890_cov_229.771953_g3433_i0:90-818(-)